MAVVTSAYVNDHTFMPAAMAECLLRKCSSLHPLLALGGWTRITGDLLSRTDARRISGMKPFPIRR